MSGKSGSWYFSFISHLLIFHLYLAVLEGHSHTGDTAWQQELTATHVNSTVATSLVNATAFLYTGSNPTQLEMNAGVIDPRRVAVVRGQVVSNSGIALTGIKVTILHYPEFGRTFTRSDGWYDMVVNGGGSLVFRFEKQGYLPVLRRIHIPWNDYVVVSGDYNAANGETRPSVPDDVDYAILRIMVSNKGARPDLLFGGVNPEEISLLAFSDMATSKSWNIMPSLEDIKYVMNKVGPKKTILAIYFRQPYVLDNASGLKDAGAILATFGVRDAAVMDILTGRFNPSGKMPFALANNARAIVEQATDAPGYDNEDTLYPFGYGLNY